MRYFDFIKEIKEISTSHILVNEYGEGDIYEYLNNGEHKYPCIFLTVTNLTTTDSGTAINFTLFYTDRLVENQANKTSIQSTGISVIKQILSKYEQLHPEYLLSNVEYTPFTEKFTDMCAGVFCDVVIENQIDTLEDYDNECEEGAFAVKTITLTKNGVYDIVGYDSAIVLVEDGETPLTAITITENGVYKPEIGGYSEVIVDVEIPDYPECPEIELGELMVSSNGVYLPEYEGVNGFDRVVVDVPSTPLYEKTITENGVYTPSDGAYSKVIVNVSSGGELTSKIKFNSLNITDDCIVDGTWPAENFDTINVTNMSSMFKGCASLKSLDVSNWDTINVMDMSSMFYECISLQSLDVSNWDTSNMMDMNHMFSNCELLQSLDVSNWDTSNVTNLSSMFNNCELLQSLDVSNWDTRNVTNMSSMFRGCELLQSLDLSNFDTSKVTDMSDMFYYCLSLQSLDLSNFDTSKVTDMNGMFSSCTSLQSLDLSNFDTSNVTNMFVMFSGCELLQSLDVSNFDTRNVTDMNQMFRGCTSLQSLDVSNFDTSNVTDMLHMFKNCRSLQSLDVSNWDASKIMYVSEMFSNCIKLTTLIGGRTMTQVLSNNISALNGLKMNISLYGTILDRASLRALINGLADLSSTTSQTLSLGSTLKAKLTEEDIAVATAKNWTIS